MVPPRVVPLGPVAVPLVVLVPFPLFVFVPDAELVPPFGPVTVALAEVVPAPLLVVLPEAVVVPPFGPVTDPDSTVPVRVFVMLP